METLFDEVDVTMAADGMIESRAGTLDWGVLVEDSQGGVSAYVVGLDEKAAAALLRRAADALDPPALSDLDAKGLGPFARESETSRQAALAVYPRQGTDRRRILDAFATGKGRMQGFTREELAGWTGLPDNTIRPRVRELVVGGWVAQGSKDRAPATRPTRAGHDSEVLMLTGRAVERLQRKGG